MKTCRIVMPTQSFCAQPTEYVAFTSCVEGHYAVHQICTHHLKMLADAGLQCTACKLVGLKSWLLLDNVKAIDAL